MEQPTISTNPLSMLAPGIFRRIFEGHIPTGKDAPSNIVPPARAVAPNAPQPQAPAPKSEAAAPAPSPNVQ